MRRELGDRSLKDLIRAADARSALSFAGDGHLLEQNRSDPDAASRIHIVADRGDVLEHVAQDSRQW